MSVMRAHNVVYVLWLKLTQVMDTDLRVQTPLPRCFGGKQPGVLAPGGHPRPLGGRN